MSSKQVTVEVDAEMYDVSQALVGVAAGVKQALTDGWQPGSDLPVIIGEVISHLADKMQMFQSLPAEAKANPAGFVKALTLSAADMYDAMK